MNIQKGMSLIEVLVTLLIGTLIIAAGLQVLLTSTLSYNVQKSMAELQDNGNFGLSYIVRDIKLANLDATQSIINDRNSYGGIVLTSRNSYSGLSAEKLEQQSMNLPSNLKTSVDIDMLSRSALHSSSTAQNSDQLVIQYRAYEAGTFDCEGNSISQTDVDDGTFIVQRYFLRSESDGFALVCDAGRYKSLVGTLPTTIQGYGANAQVIVRRADYFRVLLGIKENNSDNFRYVSIEDYFGNSTNSLVENGQPRPRVMSLQLGLLSRSYDVITDNEEVPTTFKVLDQNVTITDQDGPKYLREVVSQTIALRNGYGLMEDL